MPLYCILCVCVCCSVTSRPGNRTIAVDAHSKARNQWSAHVSVSTAEDMIEVWIQTHNALGSEGLPAPVNYVLWDIGKTVVISDCYSSHTKILSCYLQQKLQQRQQKKSA